MEPQIQYCKTSDGVSIAYWAMGEGDPIVDMGTPPFSHIHMEWQLPEMRGWYERFLARHMLVRFDARGCGMSDRDPQDFSLDALVRDLEAVVDRLGLDKFTLLGSINSAPPAIVYAASRPDRVSRLILWCPYTLGPDFFDAPGSVASRATAQDDWESFSYVAAHSRLGWADGEAANRFAALIRAAVTQENQLRLMETLRTVDVVARLGLIQAPTLVLHRSGRFATIAPAIAAAIPNSRLALFEGKSSAPYLADAGQIWGAIAGFLGEPTGPMRSDAGSNATATLDRATLRTILFTDVVANTALLQRLGDDAWRTVLRDHERVTREQLVAHGGDEIKAMGDGFMASFGSASSALECAIALQRAFGAVPNDQRLTTSDQLRVRIGVNAGEPIAEDDDLFGTAVTMAARIMGQAKGGEILVSDVVRQLVAGKSFLFADRGEAVLRGFDDPVRLYQLRLPDDGAQA